MSEAIFDANDPILTYGHSLQLRTMKGLGLLQSIRVWLAINRYAQKEHTSCIITPIKRYAE